MYHIFWFTLFPFYLIIIIIITYLLYRKRKMPLIGYIVLIIVFIMIFYEFMHIFSYVRPFTPFKVCAFNQDTIYKIIENIGEENIDNIDKEYLIKKLNEQFEDSFKKLNVKTPPKAYYRPFRKIIVIRNKIWFDTKYDMNEFLQCPNGGSYIIIIKDGKLKIFCTYHGELHQTNYSDKYKEYLLKNRRK